MTNPPPPDSTPTQPEPAESGGRVPYLVAVVLGLVVVIVAVLFFTRSREQPSASTTTTLPGHHLAVALTWHFTPSDRSGVGRQDDRPDSPCGTSGFTGPTDDLAFMSPGVALLQDEHRVTIGQAHFGAGVTRNLRSLGGVRSEFDCMWQIDFGTVPEANFYSVSIAGHEILNFSQEEAGRAGGDIKAQLHR